MAMFQPEIEAAPAEERADVQLQRLRSLVTRLAGSSSPFWRDRLRDTDPDDLRDPSDVTSLPFTRKSDLRASYPWSVLAVPVEETVRVHASSGTSGKPTIVGYTARDIDVFAEVVARSIVCAGGGPRDLFHVAYGYGLFTGGLGLHYGGELLGATVVPASGGNTALQLTLLQDLGATGLACTPSFAMLLAEHAADQGIAGLRVRYIVAGAEPWSDEYREKLQDAWEALTGQPVAARDIYGLSEVMGPGVAMECLENPGALHVFDDHFLPEIIDPETEQPLPDGEFGELVLTTLTKEAFPVVRYRTGDVTHLERGTCTCGRTHPRIGRIQGRTDDMMIIRGVNVFPREIEATILEEPRLNGAYAIVVDRRGTMVGLEIHAEVADAADATDELRDLLHDRLASRLRLNTNVMLGPPGSLPRTAVGKVKRVYTRTGDEDPLEAARSG